MGTIRKVSKLTGDTQSNLPDGLAGPSPAVATPATLPDYVSCLSGLCSPHLIRWNPTNQARELSNSVRFSAEVPSGASSAPSIGSLERQLQ